MSAAISALNTVVLSGGSLGLPGVLFFGFIFFYVPIFGLKFFIDFLKK